MSRLRSEVLEWLADGRAAPGCERQVLLRAGLIPTSGDWRLFLSRLALWLGTLALAAAVIFFLAYNWDSLGRFAKFGLVEAAMLAALVACWRSDLNEPAGKAVLVLLSLLTGALLALTGQVYQTGADTFELFAWWAALILPWVLVGRFSPLWLLWLALLNLAVLLYDQVGGRGDAVLWSLLGLNTAALAAWEAANRAGLSWLRDSWPPRLVALAATAAATSLAIEAVFDGSPGFTPAIAYALWLGAFCYWYRRIRCDLFMLAAALLSLVLCAAAWLTQTIPNNGAGGALLIGLVVIIMSGGGAMWLRHIGREQEA